MNTEKNTAKTIDLEKVDITRVEASLRDMIGMYSRMYSGSIPVSDWSKQHTRDTIKDLCDTISQWADLLPEYYSSSSQG